MIHLPVECNSWKRSYLVIISSVHNLRWFVNSSKGVWSSECYRLCFGEVMVVITAYWWYWLSFGDTMAFFNRHTDFMVVKDMSGYLCYRILTLYCWWLSHFLCTILQNKHCHSYSYAAYCGVYEIKLKTNSVTHIFKNVFLGSMFWSC